MDERVLGRYPKAVKLKDDSVVKLRPLKEEDMEILYHFFLTSVSEDDLMLLKDNVKDYNVVESWCKNIDYDRVFPLVAEGKEGRILGNATLHHRDYGWSKAVAKIRVLTCATCRGLGLGTAMIRELLEVAQFMGVEKVMAEVLSSQEAAMEALEKLGFQKVASIPRLARDYKGGEHDLCTYLYTIKPQWDEF